jgi:uncharacterized protein (DUF1501 family)
MCEQHSGHTPQLQKEKHNEEHHFWSRRSFLQSLGLAGGSSFLLGSTQVSAMRSSLLGLGLSQQNSDRILVMIRLKGGNDGLNTVIPLFDYGRYQSFRPNIAIPNQAALSLGGELGLHPALSEVKGFWDSGAMKLINNVGYPEQNLSHFRSSDIWATSSDAAVTWDTGFLGRLFDDQYPDFLLNPPDIPPAVQIGGLGNLAFTGEDNVNYAVTVASPEVLQYIAEAGGLFDAQNVPDCFYGEQVAYLRTVANNTFKYAKVISDAWNAGVNKVGYTGSFGEQLAITSRLIKGNLGTRLYMVTLDGFDTHAGQSNSHGALLRTLSQNLAAFYEDLKADGLDERVLSFTFSEFGRRIQQNASQGTDHGAAAPMFVFGPALNGAAQLGGLPSLTDLDANGNLKHRVDFRSIYATLMDYWLCIDPNLVDVVLGNDFNRLNLGIFCQPTQTTTTYTAPDFHQEVRYDGPGNPWLYMKATRPMQVKVEVFSATGQLMRQHPSVFLQGDELLPLHYEGFRISGYYIYRIYADNKVHSGKFLIRN